MIFWIFLGVYFLILLMWILNTYGIPTNNKLYSRTVNIVYVVCFIICAAWTGVMTYQNQQRDRELRDAEWHKILKEINEIDEIDERKMKEKEPPPPKDK